MWEHAYLFRFEGNKGAYVDKFWEFVDWGKVSEVFEKFKLACSQFECRNVKTSSIEEMYADIMQGTSNSADETRTLRKVSFEDLSSCFNSEVLELIAKNLIEKAQSMK